MENDLLLIEVGHLGAVRREFEGVMGLYGYGERIWRKEYIWREGP